MEGDAWLITLVVALIVNALSDTGEPLALVSIKFIKKKYANIKTESKRLFISS